MRILHTPLCQVCNGRANKVTSVILTRDYSNALCPMFPRPPALLCVVPYHVLGMFCQYWHLSIHTVWSNLPGLALLHSLCVACREFSYTDRAERCLPLRCQFLCHCMLGQDRDGQWQYPVSWWGDPPSSPGHQPSAWPTRRPEVGGYIAGLW